MGCGSWGLGEATKAEWDPSENKVFTSLQWKSETSRVMPRDPNHSGGHHQHPVRKLPNAQEERRSQKWEGDLALEQLLLLPAQPRSIRRSAGLALHSGGHVVHEKVGAQGATLCASPKYKMPYPQVLSSSMRRPHSLWLYSTWLHHDFLESQIRALLGRVLGKVN